MALRRIQKELTDLVNNPIPGVSAAPRTDDDLLQWRGSIAGPAGSPYEGGVFKFDIVFTIDYPFKPPTVKFSTKIYHPNIGDDGGICMGLLKSEAWKPSTKTVDILNTLVNLFSEPNPDDPLSTVIAEEYRSNRAEFNAKARQWVATYAKP
ncbi:hypothetical protein AMAG_02195 [Allomyces macrogynus ATCC 38327]|uniref:E2 ubiquitin-conjugating enzyme n=1 Tax=Allomyces macrogynus (strain ATCC 38327) TaxID=578462 RepID=A0A0L0S1Z3_ALLM3|nr:hypothetical protein GGF31_003222 [Allomyces arbusculus]KNE54736.1 hypothetical protein AMAG_00695 [Allomyces macrogynus ATCC 38327]KNE56384.1 hypothetical protein AMAG_02195 [Allomyces macrogynus ATCC 38327]|eukprot:KNE54736.1 hypothetical protein AMAG_00695 [Allomyces macrogynus ATCC 38327]